jgi:hypothetical protein
MSTSIDEELYGFELKIIIITVRHRVTIHILLKLVEGGKSWELSLLEDEDLLDVLSVQFEFGGVCGHCYEVLSHLKLILFIFKKIEYKDKVGFPTNSDGYLLLTGN